VNSGRDGRRLLVAALACAASLGALAPDSVASHNNFNLVSIGPTGGNGALPTQFVGASADGTRVFTRTRESLASSDTDTIFDLYEHAGGVTSQLSIGPAGGNSEDHWAWFGGASSDGTHVFFETGEPLVASDTDDCEPLDPLPNGCTDVYERAGASTTLVSPDPVGGGEDYGARIEDTSQDGGRVLIRTRAQLVGGDTDDSTDLYERAGGTTTLISTGSSGGNGAFDVFSSDMSADGSRVFFVTSEQLVVSDSDSAADVYERSGGATTLISTGPAGGNGAFEAPFRAASRDGSRVFFETEEALVASDNDTSQDVYQRSGGATTLLSTGPAGGNGAFEGLFNGASEGGTKVFFQTDESLTASDTDSALDIYERSGGATTLISTGLSGGNGPFDALFQSVSSDGSRIVFSTAESMVGADTDGRLDLYQRSGGATTLLSTGPSGGNGPFDAFFSEMSRDGQRVFFETAEQLAGDTDAFSDVYEREGGTTTRLSSGPGGGGNDEFIAVFLGTSDDGSRVFFSSAEKLVSSDTDNFSDVYVASITSGYARPAGATPTKVSLVPAYKQCEAAGANRTHGPPPLGGGASDLSCSPPVQLSDHLTVGTPDSNSLYVQSMGVASFVTLVGDPGTPADEADVRLQLSITDIRRKSDLSDYAGELQANASVRITDKYNGSVPSDPGVVSDLSFPFTVPCATTSNPNSGSTCAVTTTADTLVPGAIREGARAIWQLGQVEVYDGGADGDVDTAPNTLFARQGIFIP
jgi:hypothetical protein